MRRAQHECILFVNNIIASCLLRFPYQNRNAHQTTTSPSKNLPSPVGPRTKTHSPAARSASPPPAPCAIDTDPLAARSAQSASHSPPSSRPHREHANCTPPHSWSPTSDSIRHRHRCTAHRRRPAANAARSFSDRRCAAGPASAAETAARRCRRACRRPSCCRGPRRPDGRGRRADRGSRPPRRWRAWSCVASRRRELRRERVRGLRLVSIWNMIVVPYFGKRSFLWNLFGFVNRFFSHSLENTPKNMKL